MVRAFVPWVDGLAVVDARSGERRRRWSACTPRASSRPSFPGREPLRLPPARRGRRGRGARVPGPLRLPVHPRASWTSTCWARARTCGCTTSSARTPASWRGCGACASPSGRRTRERVSVVGDFNQWDGRRHVMRQHPGVGIWEIFVPGLADRRRSTSTRSSRASGAPFLKSDPVAFQAELRPATASVVHGLEGYEWSDEEWMETRAGARRSSHGPMAVYEVHLGSWRWREGPAAHLPRDGGGAARLRGGDGLHARGVPPGDGAPLRPLVGLPGHRLLRPHQPLRRPRRLQAPRRPPAPARHRRDPRLGARRTSPRTPRACGASTAPRSTSTRIRARASTPTGAR